MDINSWTTGLAVALILGGVVTQYYARKIKILVGKNDPAYRISIPMTIGVVENLFFTLGLVKCVYEARS